VPEYEQPPVRKRFETGERGQDRQRHIVFQIRPSTRCDSEISSRNCQSAVAWDSELATRRLDIDQSTSASDPCAAPSLL
jgi:hypothetical protein